MKRKYSAIAFTRPVHYLRQFFFIGLFSLGLIACSSNGGNNTETSTSAAPAKENAPSDKGIGPVSTVSLGALDETLAASGKAVFESKCTACHKIETKVVGPALGGITKRRKPEWIMNMILNPTEMIQKDPAAKELLATYIATMANQNLTQEEARAVLEYFRSNDNK